MALIGNSAWCAFVNRKILAVHLPSPERTRPSLLPVYPAPASPGGASCATREAPPVHRWRGLLRFFRRHGRLLDPIANSLLCRFELLGQFRGLPPVSSKFDNSVSEFIGVWWTGFWHGQSRSVSKVKKCPPNRVRSTLKAASADAEDTS